MARLREDRRLPRASRHRLILLHSSRWSTNFSLIQGRCQWLPTRRRSLATASHSHTRILCVSHKNGEIIASADINHSRELIKFPRFFLFSTNYSEVEKHKAIAAEIEAEGARILALQAEQSRNQPQQNQYSGQQQQQNYQQQPSNSYNYQAQPSNNVYRQQPTHSGYNQNAQAVNPQQSYLPPHQRNSGKKWMQN